MSRLGIPNQRGLHTYPASGCGAGCGGPEQFLVKQQASASALIPSIGDDNFITQIWGENHADKPTLALEGMRRRSNTNTWSRHTKVTYLSQADMLSA